VYAELFARVAARRNNLFDFCGVSGQRHTKAIHLTIRRCAGIKKKLLYVQFKEGGMANTKVNVHNGMYTLGGDSNHDDQNQLVNFVKRMRVKPPKIRIMHGGEWAKRALKAKFEDLFECEVLIP
jgi:predicted metal-dependent RNase